MTDAPSIVPVTHTQTTGVIYNSPQATYLSGGELLKRLRRVWGVAAGYHTDDEFIDIIIRERGELLAFRAMHP